MIKTVNIVVIDFGCINILSYPDDTEGNAQAKKAFCAIIEKNHASKEKIDYFLKEEYYEKKGIIVILGILQEIDIEVYIVHSKNKF